MSWSNVSTSDINRRNISDIKHDTYVTIGTAFIDFLIVVQKQEKIFY